MKTDISSNGWRMWFTVSPAVSSGLLLLILPGLVEVNAIAQTRTNGQAWAKTVPAPAESQAGTIPFPEIGARATASYQGDALSVTATAEGARLRCGSQKLEGDATPEGLWLESTKPGAIGRLRLTATALGRDRSRARECALTEPDRMGLFAPTDVGSYTGLATNGKVSVSEKLVRLIRPGVIEEYSVSVDGVRQDFVITAPPAGAGDLGVELALIGARAEPTAHGAKLTFEGSGRTLAYSRLHAIDGTGRELRARLEVLSADRLRVAVADTSATYPVRIDPTFSDADWVSLGSGVGSYMDSFYVNALAVSGTNLYAGGFFATVGGVRANNIAKWDGTAWAALDSRVIGAPPALQFPSVVALAVSGTDLYAGGCFTTAGGVSASYIAKWDGSAWSALGSGITSPPPNSGYASVLALVVSGTTLYVGGCFTAAGGVPANCIAKWDGHAWSALGSGVNSYGGTAVRALAVSGTNLYAGGMFGTVSGVNANYIARWDGHAWSALGSGMDDTVRALAVCGTNLYAGGQFMTAGGVWANYIAKWNGSAWSALGSGVEGYGPVYALAVSGTDLYAGGRFWLPGNNIAKWDGSAWFHLGSGVGDCPSALAVDGLGHLFVGGDFSLAGTKACYRIAQANVGSIPTIVVRLPTQTAEAGNTVSVVVDATGEPPPVYQWYFNGSNLLNCASYELVLTNIQFSQTGTYVVVATNEFGAVTSAPVMVNVIAPVQRRPVPGVNLMGEAGRLLSLDYADFLRPAPNWTALASISLTSPPQYWFDLTLPLQARRFYRAWQTGTPSVIPSLDLHTVPAITLTGSIGGLVRVDYINRVGPIDAWVTLDTVTLTNTTQLYFDTSSIGQPARLWRLVPAP